MNVLNTLKAELVLDMILLCHSYPPTTPGPYRYPSIVPISLRWTHRLPPVWATDLLPALPVHQISFSFSVMPFVPTSFHASFHGSLWASSCQWVLAEAAAASVFIPGVSQSCPWPPPFPGDPPVLAGRSGPVSYEVTALFPGSWCAHDIGCALHIWSFFSPHSLVEFLGSKAAGLQSYILWGLLLLLPDPQAGKPYTVLRTFTSVTELVINIIAFQFAGCPPDGYGIWFYCTCALPTIFLWLLLCLWM